MFKTHRGVTLNLVAALHSLLDDATRNYEKQEHCSHHTFEDVVIPACSVEHCHAHRHPLHYLKY